MASESNFSPDFFDPSADYFGGSGTKFFSVGEASTDEIFGILEALEGVSDEFTTFTPLDEMKHGGLSDQLVSQKSSSSSGVQEPVEAVSQGTKRQKVSPQVGEGCESLDGSSKVNHVTVERNRRKTMNEHLAILRSLMPCFYVKRGDQASIIGGVIDYITELQQVLQSLEAKKKRKVYSDVLSPRLISSPRTLPLSPRKPPLSPRPSLPISPRFVRI